MGITPPPPLPAAPTDGNSATRADTEKPGVPRKPAAPAKPEEIGGPPGPEPTRYGDWQFNGRVTDF
jgi:hypothetical protein